MHGDFYASLRACKQRNPPVVVRIVAGFEGTLPTHVRCRVDQPGRMQTKRRAEEDTPQHKTHPEVPATERSACDKKHDSNNREWPPMVLADPDMGVVLTPETMPDTAMERPREKRLVKVRKNHRHSYPPMTLNLCSISCYWSQR